MSERILLEVEMDASGAVTGSRQVERGLDRIGKASTKSTSGVSRLGGAIKAFIAIQVAQRLASTVRVLFDLGTAAEETAAKFSTVFGPATQALDAELEGLANRMGLTQTEARALTSTVGAVVQGMGFGQAASADFSAELIKLAGDLVSFSNVEGGTERVTQALTSALTGEREALKTLGIVISEADVKQRQAQRAAEGHADAMTRQGKATATLELITERAGVAVGDLERTQDSTANTARRVSAEIREQAQTFAQQLLPVYGMVLGALDELIDKSAGGITALSRLASEGIFETVAALVEMVKATMLAVDAMNDAAGVSVGLGDVLSQVQTEIRNVTSFMNTMAAASIRAAIFVNDLKAAVLSLGITLRQTRINIFGGDDSSLKEMRQNLTGLAHNAATLRGDLSRLNEAQEEIGQSTDDWRERMESALETLGNLGTGLSQDFNPVLDQTAGKTTLVKTALQKLQEGITDLRAELASLQSIAPEALGSLYKEKDDIEEQIERLERFARELSNLASAVENYGANAGEFANGPPVELGGREGQTTTGGSDNERFEAVLPVIDHLRKYGDDFEQIASDAEKSADRVFNAAGKMQAAFLDLGPAMQDGLSDAVSALSLAVGDMLAGTASLEDVGAAILGTLGDLAVRMGKMMIGFGIAALKLRTLITNPFAAIAAGTALVALGALAQSTAGNLIAGATGAPSGAATGGSAPGGSLPSGTSTLPAALSLPRQGQAAPVNTINVPAPPPAEISLYLDGELVTDRVEIVQRRRTRSGRTGGEL